MESWWEWIERKKIPNEHFEEEVKSSAKHFSKCKEKCTSQTEEKIWKGVIDIWEGKELQRESQKCTGSRETVKGFEVWIESDRGVLEPLPWSI